MAYFRIAPQVWPLLSKHSVVWSARNYSKNDPTAMQGDLDFKFFFLLTFGETE